MSARIATGEITEDEAAAEVASARRGGRRPKGDVAIHATAKTKK
jgi:hypothetical protein